MRYFLFIVLSLLLGQARSQDNCRKSSPLFRFDPREHPRLFTDKLGNHPQFPFLQREKGVTTPNLVIHFVKDPESQVKYPEEFKIFDQLLKDIGFVRGYKDLHTVHVRKSYVQDGTIGNLGFYNNEKPQYNYIYVRLNPAGEGRRGIPAWKITGPSGCWFYILHTCGNAFYPGHTNDDCCKEIKAETRINPLEIKPQAVDRPLHIKITFYEGRILPAHRRNGKADTLVTLLRSIDTLMSFRDTIGHTLKVYVADTVSHLLVCRDTVLQLRPRLLVDSTPGAPDSVQYVLSDTAYVSTPTKGNTPCQKKWEIALDGGISFNSIPRFDNTTIHTRTDGSHPAAELAISRIFNHWFQAGVMVSYITLSYQDDVAYPGSAPNTYNTVYIGKPILPIQLFGKATIGGPLRWQSNVSLSAGWSLPMKDQIINGGNTLATKPGVKGGPTAGFKMGVAYFFSCKFGLGLTFSGQYFSNKADAMSYHLFALPITLGIRYRF
ncbi:hypothetical protein Q4E93_12815 [Flavitalea sp. BT771]|uniref:hypothetical protein n=1 Tax=Flavitalea sp. BT771 TaxID=3063329 RepID=UPI0026E21988|nr:hypothetical protein [Flavitalea sp. BT771]MDO6431478.1 hypothetical protein [Flavitalea sp. BT771]MDV6220386.1 hypothetical protein [Flavitalea sp. BT771]